MYKFTNTLLKRIQSISTYKPGDVFIQRHKTIPTALKKLRNHRSYVYMFTGVTFGSCVAYKYTSVNCDTDVINADTVEESKPEKWKLYQYATCPFCCKVRTFMEYYGIDYETVEVNPVTRKEIKFSDYRKVPFLKSENFQINDSSLIISVLKSNYLVASNDIGTLLTYYPFLEDEKNKGKGEHQNKYNIMYHEEFTKEQNQAILEEAKWRRWIDQSFIHTLSPNIYRTIKESLQAMEYITQVGNFSDFECKLIYYTGAIAMYLIGKRLKSKYHLKSDVRESLYEETRMWIHNVGKKGPYMGGEQPNLADLNMYGVISAIEGLDAFNDLMNNTNISPWYKRMKKQVKSHAGCKSEDWLQKI